LKTAIKNGTKEVLSPIFAGTIATIAILFPLMFVGRLVVPYEGILKIIPWYWRIRTI